MIATLNTLNKNINSLGEPLKNVGIGGEKEDMANKDFKKTKGEINETRGLVECSSDLNQECATLEIQSANKLVETL